MASCPVSVDETVHYYSAISINQRKATTEVISLAAQRQFNWTNITRPITSYASVCNNNDSWQISMSDLLSGNVNDFNIIYTDSNKVSNQKQNIK